MTSVTSRAGDLPFRSKEVSLSCTLERTGFRSLEVLVLATSWVAVLAVGRGCVQGWSADLLWPSLKEFPTTARVGLPDMGIVRGGGMDETTGEWMTCRCVEGGSAAAVKADNVDDVAVETVETEDTGRVVGYTALSCSPGWPQLQ